MSFIKSLAGCLYQGKDMDRILFLVGVHCVIPLPFDPGNIEDTPRIHVWEQPPLTSLTIADE